MVQKRLEKSSSKVEHVQQFEVIRHEEPKLPHIMNGKSNDQPSSYSLNSDTIDFKNSQIGKPQTTASSKSALSGSLFQPNSKYIYSNGALRKDYGD
jgi:hypothetical protein